MAGIPYVSSTLLALPRWGLLSRVPASSANGTRLCAAFQGSIAFTRTLPHSYGLMDVWDAADSLRLPREPSAALAGGALDATAGARGRARRPAPPCGGFPRRWAIAPGRADVAPRPARPSLQEQKLPAQTLRGAEPVLGRLSARPQARSDRQNLRLRHLSETGGWFTPAGPGRVENIVFRAPMDSAAPSGCRAGYFAPNRHSWLREAFSHFAKYSRARLSKFSSDLCVHGGRRDPPTSIAERKMGLWAWTGPSAS